MERQGEGRRKGKERGEASCLDERILRMREDASEFDIEALLWSCYKDQITHDGSDAYSLALGVEDDGAKGIEASLQDAYKG
jgi:hypothetical protein